MEYTSAAVAVAGNSTLITVSGESAAISFFTVIITRMFLRANTFCPPIKRLMPGFWDTVRT